MLENTRELEWNKSYLAAIPTLFAFFVKSQTKNTLGSPGTFCWAGDAFLAVEAAVSLVAGAVSTVALTIATANTLQKRLSIKLIACNTILKKTSFLHVLWIIRNHTKLSYFDNHLVVHIKI